ncbi:hypothetical protein [Kitasatospora sp. NPDC058046]|uniref:hypothetical protein n=1 Tax=Kitasatospora sp. NPDC058046 TaxID=3346312 RepID=UPI0036DF26F9
MNPRTPRLTAPQIITAAADLAITADPIPANARDAVADWLTCVAARWTTASTTHERRHALTIALALTDDPDGGPILADR